MDSETIRDRLLTVRQRMGEAARRAGRSPDDVRLVAVSKTVEPARIREIVEAGQLLLGENKVQEARDKVEAVGGGAHWHLVGHLQKNKARDAVRLFEMIHSVDSVPLIRELNRQAERQGKILPVLVQINLDRERSKHGVLEEDVPSLLEQAAEFTSVRVQGLMIIPEYHPEPEKSRPAFRRLAEIARKMKDKGIEGVEMKELSMGMTEDFEVAIEEGATLVRIGRALFGERPQPQGKEPL